MIETIQQFCEKQTFGVCTWWGKKLGMDSGRVRKAFIYTSFLTFGSPVVLYLAMAFLLENRHYFKLGVRKASVWEID